MQIYTQIHLQILTPILKHKPLPIDIILDILQYLNPNKLHILADSSELWRCIVNNMARSSYIERWLDIVSCRYTHIPHINKLTPASYYIANLWYFKLGFEKKNYMYLLNYLDKCIQTNTLYNTFLYIKILTPIYNNKLYLLSNIHTLWISLRGDPINIYHLSGVHTLYILGSPISSCPIDLSDLYNIQTLSIYGFRYISNLYSLYNIHSLTLSVCNNIQKDSWDVNMLGDLFSLTIRMGKHIHDISGLGMVYNLNLKYFKNMNVTNISALGGVHNLNLESTNTNSVVALGTVDIINLRHTSINNIDNLGSVRHLNLGCNVINNVSNLGAIDHLNLLPIKICKPDSLININVTKLYKQSHISKKYYLQAPKNNNLNTQFNLYIPIKPYPRTKYRRQTRWLTNIKDNIQITKYTNIQKFEHNIILLYKNND